METNKQNRQDEDVNDEMLDNETKLDLAGDLKLVADAAKIEKAKGKDNFEGYMDIGGNTSGPNA